MALLVLISLFIIIGLISAIFSFFFLIPFFFGAPYEPSRGKALKNIVKFADPKPGDKIAELGSGDGVVCIALARRGAEVHGYDVNPFLVWMARYRVKKRGLQDKVFIHWKSFWGRDLGEYNKVVFFQFSTIMRKLASKLKKDLKPKSRVVSHWWRIPGWELKKKIGRVYLYEV